MQAASRYSSHYDFGFVTLDCTHCYEEDSGLYMCKATNSKGSASTTGTLKCISKANIFLDTQHPQGKAGLEKVCHSIIWLKIILFAIITIPLVPCLLLLLHILKYSIY